MGYRRGRSTLASAEIKTATGRKLMKRDEYEKQLRHLQIGLCRLQDWVKQEGLRVVIVFEGRDAAGKGGTIKAITERVSPRVFRVAALPAPSDREKSQMYIQRYLNHFPAAGEIVIFDRSWYNRAGVERVMGFCTDEEHDRFLGLVPFIERVVTEGGLILAKYWLEVSKEEQERRITARVNDPVRHWKLSPMDIESWQRWDSYTQARDEMLEATDTDHSPWHIIRSDDKKAARLNCISHFLSLIPVGEMPGNKIKLPKRPKHNKFDPEKGLVGRKFIPAIF
jgi:polyphosphate kinase 2